MAPVGGTGPETRGAEQDVSVVLCSGGGGSGGMISTEWRWRRLAVCILLSLAAVGYGPLLGHCGESLYSILGVPRDASAAQIKKAYRKKALETHPDKRPNVDPELAAAEFSKVTEAYSVLSDESSRRNYDRTGSTGSGRSSGGSDRGSRQQGGFHFHFQWGGRQQRPHETIKVKQAQSRVISVVSLVQLETISLDLETDLLERNLLLVFCTPLSEKHVDQEILYPYPFAGMSTQNIWWEDILVTGKVRYNTKSDLAEKFGVGDVSKVPTFAFLRRGATLDNATLLSTRSRDEFEKWVWKLLEVPVKFVNEHYADVQVYWMHGTRGNDMGTIPPGGTMTQNTMLTHEWYFRDARLSDRFLSETVLLGKWKVMSDEQTVYVIKPRYCLDWNGNCPYWAKRGECQRNPDFMMDKGGCPLSCGVCSEEDARREAGRSGEGGGEPSAPSFPKEEL